MSDAGFDPQNPVHIAVRMTQMGEQMVAMQQQFANAQQNTGSAIQSLQVDMHRAVEQLRQIVTLNERQNQDTAAIERAWRRIEDIQSKQADAEKRMHRWAGIAIGISIMSTTLVATITWFGRQYMENNSAAMRQIRIEATAEDRRSDERLDRIEIHLAGDGDRPFKR